MNFREISKLKVGVGGELEGGGGNCESLPSILLTCIPQQVEGEGSIRPFFCPAAKSLFLADTLLKLFHLLKQY